jgi:Cu/Ag efflux protein CusF
MCLSKWISVTMAIALMANSAAAADTVSNGKVKSIDAGNKTFVLTDSAGKDWTFTLGDNLIVNRGGKESKSDLKTGDTIAVCYDKGVIGLTWTTHYILVQEGTTKTCDLIRGNVKSYDADKNELTFTNEVKKDSIYPIGKAVVRVNMENSKFGDVRIGDHALLIVETVEGKATLQSVMVHRAK